jgi:hypothetical protein
VRRPGREKNHRIARSSGEGQRPGSRTSYGAASAAGSSMSVGWHVGGAVIGLHGPGVPPGMATT